ncbi:hypothetical protein [Polaribacter sargassicola]|uniref:hypothetical protein n=1 Tax=Polaribacter sargassicola TaxID=2836891 RepID=UPI001F27E610|nr:hypothetical protein [Polaribacter sp. DS7-9]MCG1035614.1 hypothetical protein [Polaribacter sp. DS7-9]
MKYTLITIILITITTYNSFAQYNFYYEVGDTLYYKNNKATDVKTNTLVVLKEVDVNEVKDTYKVEKYLYNKFKEEFVLESKFKTLGLQELKSEGTYVSYHDNGQKSSEGETEQGRKRNGLWTYYYKNGKKKIEEEIVSNEQNNGTNNFVINFWDDKGRHTVKEGTGFAQFFDSDSLFVKGSYKDGLKNGLWTAFKDKLKRYEETYKKGKLVKGINWNLNGDASMYKTEKTEAYYKKPNQTSLRKYINKTLNPNIAAARGEVLINFLVTDKGRVEDVNIVKGLTLAYNKEIERVLLEMDGWTPAKKKGVPYSSTYSLSLKFSE